MWWACSNLPLRWATGPPKALFVATVLDAHFLPNSLPHRADVAGLPAWHWVRGTPFARQVARIFFLGALDPLPSPLLILCRRSLQLQQSTPILSSSLASFSWVSKTLIADLKPLQHVIAWIFVLPWPVVVDVHDVLTTLLIIHATSRGTLGVGFGDFGYVKWLSFVCT